MEAEVAHLLEDPGLRPGEHQHEVARLGTDGVNDGLHLVAGEDLVLDRLAEVGAVGGELGVEEAAGADLLADDILVELVHRLAAALALALDADSDDRAAVVQDALEHLELRAADGVRHVGDLHAEAEVRLVGAEAADGLGVRHPGEGRRDLDAARVAPDLRHEALDEPVDHLFGRERHLDVDLGELRLAVGAEVLVAEAFRDLDVAVHARDHQDLLVRLRALRERVELAGVDAAGHEVVARALRRRLHQDRRLDLHEVVVVEVAPRALVELAPQHHVALERRAAEGEVAVLQREVLAGLGRLGVVLGHHERRRRGEGQHLDVGDVDLHVAGRHVGVLALADADLALGRDHVLAAHPLGQGGEVGVEFGAEDELREAVAVAQVDEVEPAEVAALVDPALEDDRLPGVGLAEGAAGVRAVAVGGRVDEGEAGVGHG